MCHIYSIVCSLDVLRRLGRLSLGGLKCGINVLECALWSWKVTFATPRTMHIFEGKLWKGTLIEEKHAKRRIFPQYIVRNLIFPLRPYIFLNTLDYIIFLSLINPYS